MSFLVRMILGGVMFGYGNFAGTTTLHRWDHLLSHAAQFLRGEVKPVGPLLPSFLDGRNLFFETRKPEQAVLVFVEWSRTVKTKAQMDELIEAAEGFPEVLEILVAQKEKLPD